MRVAVMVISILVVATSSYASEACMTKEEARKHFATSYLYWHGPDHCWDASRGWPPSARNAPQKKIPQKKTEVVYKENPEPNWRDSRSELLTSNAAPSASQSEPSETSEAPARASVNVPWSDRWVDLVQAEPTGDTQPSDRIPPLKSAGGSSGTSIPAGRLILILLSMIMMLALLEFLRRSTTV